jgi:hypothetical protein
VVFTHNFQYISGLFYTGIEVIRKLDDLLKIKDISGLFRINFFFKDIPGIPGAVRTLHALSDLPHMADSKRFEMDHANVPSVWGTFVLYHPVECSPLDIFSARWQKPQFLKTSLCPVGWAGTKL